MVGLREPCLRCKADKNNRICCNNHNHYPTISIMTTTVTPKISTMTTITTTVTITTTTRTTTYHNNYDHHNLGRVSLESYSFFVLFRLRLCWTNGSSWRSIRGRGTRCIRWDTLSASWARSETRTRKTKSCSSNTTYPTVRRNLLRSTLIPLFRRKFNNQPVSL